MIARWLSTFVLGTLAGPQTSIDTVVISDQITCPSCKIALVPVVVLGQKDPPDILPLAASVTRLGNGKYLTTGIGLEREIALFSGDGQFERQNGRVGSGPGEYLQPLRVAVGLSGSIYVLDMGTRRISILNSRGEFLRSLSTREIVAQDVLELRDGSVVVAGIATSQSGAGFFLHRAARGGEAFVPIGEEIPVFDPRAHPGTYSRKLAKGSDSSFWTGRANQYVLEQRVPSGRVTKVLTKNPTWFKPWTTNWPPIEKPDNPSLYKVAQDSTGKLWVFVAVPSATFKPLAMGRVLPGPKTREQLPPSMFETWKNRDTIVEVLDPTSGALLARSRLVGTVIPAGPFPLIAQIVDGPNDTHLVRLSQLTLTPP